MAAERKIVVAIPLMDELENVPQFLRSLENQSYRNFMVVVCINQPDEWWNNQERKDICKRNQETLALLKDQQHAFFTVIDRSSPGSGWDTKKYGVGWARKIAMDHASALTGNHDIILTLDGDTTFSAHYFQSVANAFDEYPDIKAITVPYYHPLPLEDEPAARAILRYEIYMRYYAMNMLRIGNPYAFTALGSAIACTAQTYQSIGGITPHKSGEDFYFVQKLRKYGQILIWLDEKVYPAARFSDRVFFGTGPAMIRGNSGDWSGYPIFSFLYFDEIKATFDGFEKLFEKDLELPMTTFLMEKFGKDLWKPLRENASTTDRFIRACQHKVDGLRILQYLKWKIRNDDSNDEANLVEFLTRFFPEEDFVKQTNLETINFEQATIEELNRLRNFLTEKEEVWRKSIRVLR
ncbi:MAG: hypothetical protein IH598_07070 [Bacteroidales bacterium]|nr:hypothetical protein [Bacteroidales bacterium]